jgi:hypothetical protein
MMLSHLQFFTDFNFNTMFPPFSSVRERASHALEANIPAEENIKEIPWAFHRYTGKIHLPASSRGAASGHQQRASQHPHHPATMAE